MKLPHPLLGKAALAALVVAPSLWAAPALQPESSRQFFLTPNKASVLTFQVTEPEEKKDTSAVVRDMSGEEVARPEAKRGEDGAFRVEVKLPQGYHLISFPDFGQEFGLVSLPAFEGTKDPFFGIDAALSWLSKPETRKDKIEVLKYCGISIARERLSWPGVQQKENEFDSKTPREYDQVRELYKSAGIKVLEVFHNAPAWMKLDAAGAYPTDLLAASANWQKITAHWKDEWSALDLWNEPDIGFGGNQPADRYAALAKTIAYATHTVAPDVDLGAVVLAYMNLPFLELVSRNGLLEQCDYFSFHYYKESAGLAGHISDIRAWLQKSGHGSMPLWITEMGKSWVKEADEVRPAAQADLARALIFARDTIEARACGIATIFPFVFVDYSEKGTEMFGMLDVHKSPQGAMAAYAQAIRQLHGTEYIGDVKSSPGSRVFKKADGSVVIAWLGSEPPAFAYQAMEGLDGRALKAPADGLTYILTSPDKLGEELVTDTKAMALLKAAHGPERPRSAPSPIILVPRIKNEGVTILNRGYQLPDKASTITVELDVANLGPEEKTFSVDLRPPRSVKVEPASADATPAPEEAPLKTISGTIPPLSVVKTTVVISVNKLPLDVSGTAWLDFLPSDKSIAPASIAIMPSLGLGEYLKAFKYQFSVPIADLSRWTPKSAGTIDISKSQKGNWLLKAEFSKEGDRWVYPTLRLPQEVQNDRLSAVLVRARFKCPGERSTARFMTYNREAKMAVTGFAIIPNDGEWHVTLIPLSSFLAAPEGATAGSQMNDIALGFNTSADKGELEVSDLYLLGN